MTHRTDAELVDAARRGASDAFGELVRRYERSACALAYSLLGDAAEAEDMAQEAFVRALRNLDALADPSKFGAWLHRITFGTCIDWLRAFRPELYGTAVGADPALDIAGNEPSPVERLERVELARRILDAVAELPPRYRTPLSMYHLDGLSHAKVASSLGVPEGTARSLVARARRRLAALLSTDHEEHLVMKPHADEVLVEQTTPRRFLHVLNGDETRWRLEKSDVPGTFAVWADILYEGPVPGEDVTAEEWREVRARYIAQAAYESYKAALAQYERWDETLGRYREYDEVVIWCEHDLFDQLLLIRHLDWFARRDVTTTKLSLICIGEYPGFADFKGLGQLGPGPARLAAGHATGHPPPSARARPRGLASVHVAGPDPDRAIARRRCLRSALPCPRPAASSRGVSVDPRRPVPYRARDPGSGRRRHDPAARGDGRRTPCGGRVLHDRCQSPAAGPGPRR